VIYPSAIHLAGFDLQYSEMLHFFLSLAFCGLVAASFPFFFVTSLSMQAFYPALVRPQDLQTEDAQQLDWLERATWVYLAIGLLAPMLAVVLLLVFGESSHRFTLVIVSASSVAGFGLLVALAQRLQRTIAVYRNLIPQQERTGR
jgi:hypothetical protein